MDMGSILGHNQSPYDPRQGLQRNFGPGPHACPLAFHKYTQRRHMALHFEDTGPHMEGVHFFSSSLALSKLSMRASKSTMEYGLTTKSMGRKFNS